MRRTWRKPKPKPQKRFWANEQIRAQEVFLINENGERIGVVPTSQALAQAREVGLDLVEVDPKPSPPVAKIMDYGQFKYEQEKKNKAKKKQKKIERKGLRLSVRISRHDFDFRLKQAKKFLSKGHPLKIELILKGREKQHPQKGREVVESFVQALEADDSLAIEKEQDLTKKGDRFIIILLNKKPNK